MFWLADFTDQIFPFFVAAVIIVFFLAHIWQIMMVLWILGLITAAIILTVSYKRQKEFDRKLENERGSESQP